MTAQDYTLLWADRVACTVLATVAGATTVREVARALGIATASGHKWLARVHRDGLVQFLAHESGAPGYAGVRPVFEVVAGVSPVSGRWMVLHRPLDLQEAEGPS